MLIVYVAGESPGAPATVPLVRLAGEIRELGHRCVICVPTRRGRSGQPGPGGVDVVTYREAGKRLAALAERSDDLLVHTWSLGAAARGFTNRLVAGWGWRYVAHLAEHPVTAPQRRFIEAAAGATVVVDRLREALPDGLPWTTCRPTASVDIEQPAGLRAAVRADVGLADEDFAILHHGEPVPDLMLSIDLLNRQGIRARLLQVGTGRWFRRRPRPRHWYRTLGPVADADLAGLYAAADALVETGGMDSTADYRFSPRSADFLASGTPTVLPALGAGRLLTDGDQALLTRTGWAPELTGKFTRIHDDAALRERLSRGGRRFAQECLDPRIAAKAMCAFYRSVVKRTG